MHFDDLKEFSNKDCLTPLLLAAKYNNMGCITMMFEEQANIYATDNKMQNVLHYAIHNENEQMIKYFVSKDPKQRLRREKNIYGYIPIDLEKAQKFMTWLYTIWDAANGNMVNLVQKYIKMKSYEVNQRRPGDLKTPLHVAVIAGRIDMIRMLMQLGADPSLRDADGKTALNIVEEKALDNKQAKSIRSLLLRKMSYSPNKISALVNDLGSQENESSDAGLTSQVRLNL